MKSSIEADQLRTGLGYQFARMNRIVLFGIIYRDVIIFGFEKSDFSRRVEQIGLRIFAEITSSDFGLLRYYKMGSFLYCHGNTENSVFFRASLALFYSFSKGDTPVPECLESLFRGDFLLG